MAVLGKDDYMSRLKSMVGDNASDEMLSLLEDFTDTYNELESKGNNSGNAEWEKKYNDLDNSWREKYKARFFEGGTTVEQTLQEQRENVQADGEPRTFDELFTEREG